LHPAQVVAQVIEEADSNDAQHDAEAHQRVAAGVCENVEAVVTTVSREEKNHAHVKVERASPHNSKQVADPRQIVAAGTCRIITTGKQGDNGHQETGEKVHESSSDDDHSLPITPTDEHWMSPHPCSKTTKELGSKPR